MNIGSQSIFGTEKPSMDMQLGLLNSLPNSLKIPKYDLGICLNWRAHQGYEGKIKRNNLKVRLVFGS